MTSELNRSDLSEGDQISEATNLRGQMDEEEIQQGEGVPARRARPGERAGPAAAAGRRVLEEAHLADVRDLTRERLARVDPWDDLVDQVDTLLGADGGPSLADHLARSAGPDEFRDFLRQRSIYHLKESDPHAFVVPRIDGRARSRSRSCSTTSSAPAARRHCTPVSSRMPWPPAASTPPTGRTSMPPAPTLAVNTTMSVFGLHRRWRGAAMGHLAAFESTSSRPCSRIAAGARRLDLPEAVAAYYEEHIEADAVHEQLAVRGICVPLVEADPGLRQDVLLGVAACLDLDGLAAGEHLARWDVEMGVPA